MDVAEHCGKFDELYDDFERRFSSLAAPRGDKSASVEAAFLSFERPVTIRDVEFKCPGVSRETIKSVLRKHPGQFVCSGRGVGATWRKVVV